MPTNIPNISVYVNRNNIKIPKLSILFTTSYILGKVFEHYNNLYPDIVTKEPVIRIKANEKKPWSGKKIYVMFPLDLLNQIRSIPQYSLLSPKQIIEYALQ